MQDNTPRWYVIQVISGTEENVKQSLFQRRESFGLEEYIIDVFVPTHDVVSVRAGGTKVKKKKNILPGYILVEMVVSNEKLAQLKWKVESKEETFSTKFKTGEMAMITAWAFEGNEGMITDVNDAKWLVKVNINLLWRDTPIELDFSQIVVK